MGTNCDGFDDLVRRLREEGSTGLDLSPGLEVCREAAEAIEQLRADLSEADRLANRRALVRFLGTTPSGAAPQRSKRHDPHI